MSFSIGELVGYVKMDDSDFQSGAGRVEGKAKSLGGSIAKAAKVGVAAAVAGLGGLVVGAGKQFSALESGMNEVFTLLPGISQKSMDGMTGQVEQFAKDFGVLPDEVVPALYQALSSGIPADNVFSYLETAQKAAKGGVTELETAVDGISSVVNAYGSDVLSATNASDLMFTAVRLGKTNFAQLSESLFNVIPTASSLGVEFGNVTAALATMTAQGVPTSVATTQMRQMLVELSKDGSATAGVFEKIAGKSFKEFIAGGGNLQDALQLLDGEAKKNGKSISDMFGSVEAGAAALSLTGKGSDRFRDALKGMDQSAGATDKAFDQMDQGLSNSWAHIKSAAAVALVDMGRQLAPTISQVADLAEGAMPALANAAVWLGEALGKVATAAGQTVQWLNEHRTTAVTLAAVIVALTAATLAHEAALAVAAAGGLAKWLLQTNLISAATKVWAAVQWVLNAALTANPIGLAVVAIAALVAAIVIAWQKSDTFRAIVTKSWEAIRKATQTAFNFVRDHIKTIMAVVLVILTGGLGALVLVVVKNWSTIKEKTAAAWGWVKDKVSMVLHGIRAVVEAVATVVTTIIRTEWNAVKAVTSAVWRAVKAVVAAQVRGVVAVVDGIAAIVGKFTQWFGKAKDAATDRLKVLVVWLGGLPGRILTAVGDLGRTLYNAGLAVIQGLIDGITDKVGSLQSKLGAVTKLIPDWKGPADKDAKLLRHNGQLIMRGLIDGINDGTKDLQKLLRGVTEKLSKQQMARVADAVEATYRHGVKVADRLDKLGGRIATAMDKLHDAIGARNDFRRSVKEAAISFGSVLNSTADTSSMELAEQARANLADAERAFEDFARSIADTAMSYGSAVNTVAGEDGALSADAVVTQMQERLAAIVRFRENMATLLSEGLDLATYQDMLAKGAEQAGSLAQALVDGGADAVANIADLSAQITDAAAGLGQDAATALYGAGVDAAQAYADGLSGATDALTSQQIVAQMQDRLAQVEQFHANMEQLLSEGLDEATYKQMLAAGIDQSGAIAQALVDGPESAVQQVADLSAQLGVEATALGVDGAQNLYAAGVHAAEGLVSGLKARRKELRKVARDLADMIRDEIRRALEIHSPSRATERDGVNTVLGLAGGLSRAARFAVAAARDVADGVAAAMTPNVGGLAVAGAPAGFPARGTRQAGDGIDYDRLAAALAGTAGGGNGDVLDALSKVAQAVTDLPRQIKFRNRQDGDR